MSHRPYPNVDRTRHQLDRHRDEARPTPVAPRFSSSRPSAVRAAFQRISELAAEQRERRAAGHPAPDAQRVAASAKQAITQANESLRRFAAAMATRPGRA